tara:strand:- start:912 stop:1169 length:258 start_codon:yes stop_codon:yes gene_type:complete
MDLINETDLYNFLAKLDNNDLVNYFKVVEKFKRRYRVNGSISVINKTGRKTIILTAEQLDTKRKETNIKCRDKARVKALMNKKTL